MASIAAMATAAAAGDLQENLRLARKDVFFGIEKFRRAAALVSQLRLSETLSEDPSSRNRELHDLFNFEMNPARRDPDVLDRVIALVPSDRGTLKAMETSWEAHYWTTYVLRIAALKKTLHPTIEGVRGVRPYLEGILISETHPTIIDQVVEELKTMEGGIEAGDFHKRVLADICGASGSLYAVEKLLALGAPVDGRVGMHCYRESPLLVASMYGSLEIVQKLVASGAEVNRRSSYGNRLGYTALHLAAEFGHYLTIGKYLVEAGADETILSHSEEGIRRGLGRTPLQLHEEYLRQREFLRGSIRA